MIYRIRDITTGAHYYGTEDYGLDESLRLQPDGTIKEMVLDYGEFEGWYDAPDYRVEPGFVQDGINYYVNDIVMPNNEYLAIVDYDDKLQQFCLVRDLTINGKREKTPICPNFGRVVGTVYGSGYL